MENLTLILIFIGIILIIFTKITLKTKIMFDVVKNDGKFNVLLFSKIKIVNFGFKVVGKYLVVTKKNGKKKLIDLNPKGKDIEFYNNLNKQLFKHLIIKNSFVFVDVGVKNNSFLTSLLSGYIQLFFSIFLTKLQNQKKEIKTINNVYPKYDRETLELTIKARIAISIYGVTKSFLVTFIKKQKTNKVKKEIKAYE